MKNTIEKALPILPLAVPSTAVPAKSSDVAAVNLPPSVRRTKTVSLSKYSPHGVIARLTLAIGAFESHDCCSVCSSQVPGLHVRVLDFDCDPQPTLQSLH